MSTPFANEIIRKPSGNTYIGGLATRFSYGALTLPPLPSGPFHVIEIVGKEIIHRAAQSTRELALAYMGPNRDIVS